MHKRRLPFGRANYAWLLILLAGLLLAGCLSRSSIFPPSSSTASTLERVTAANFDERVLRSELPVMVDFYADWCGPCQQLGPVLEEVARENHAARIVKVNIDQASPLAARYGVEKIPTLIVFRGGQIQARSLGLIGKKEVQEMLAQ